MLKELVGSVSESLDQQHLYQAKLGELRGDNQDESKTGREFPVADPLEKMERLRVLIDKNLFEEKILPLEIHLMVKKNGLVD
jgi:hypothetical protein